MKPEPGDDLGRARGARTAGPAASGSRRRASGPRGIGVTSAGHAASSSVCARVGRRAAVVPVRCRKTSSSVGRRTPTSSASMPARLELPEQGADSAASRSLDRRADPSRRRSTSAVAPATRARGRRGRGRSAAWRTTHSSRSPPMRDLSSSGVPVGDDPPGVDDADPVGELVGLVEVLGGQQHGRAVARRARGSRSRPRCARAGRGRSSARRGTGPPARG